MTFTSRRIKVLDRTAVHYRVIGALTIRDVTHEVSLDAWTSLHKRQGTEDLRAALRRSLTVVTSD